MSRLTALTLAFVLTCLGTAVTEAADTRLPADGDFAGSVDIGGRSLYLECRGSGSPTVILESGYRTAAVNWTEDLVQPDAPRTMVLPGVAEETRVCAYERPGVAAELADGFHPSQSDPVPMPRNPADVVADLHALLAAVGETGPYVLAGHSLGGIFVRLYAATYPDEVAGLVLVDALSPGLERYLGPEHWDIYARFNLAPPPELAEYPDIETLDFTATCQRLRAAEDATPLPPLPLFVLSKGQSFGVPADMLGFDPDELDAAWARAQDELGLLTPDARHVVATESGHYIQLQQPELVIDAIHQVVEAVRNPSTWAAEPAAPTG